MAELNPIAHSFFVGLISCETSTRVFVCGLPFLNTHTNPRSSNYLPPRVLRGCLFCVLVVGSRFAVFVSADHLIFDRVSAHVFS